MFKLAQLPHKMRSSGFTLIELMIVITIIAILAAISYPMYTEYTERSRRAEGRAALLDTAAKLERYYSDNNVYASKDNSLENIYGTNNTSKKTENGYYTISITTKGTYQTYTLTATPTVTDKKCANLTLTHTGKRGKTGSKDLKYCWGK